MEAYIQISYLNDFIFCPRSIYFHGLYNGASTRLYHRPAQTKGKAAHKAVDKGKYSNRAHILQNTEIYSQQYRLCGRVDTFDTKTGLLSERKRLIKHIYDGYIFQLYAQYFCLTEMGYEVKKIRLYSISDNKSYPITLPKDDPEMLDKFKQLISNINQYDLNQPFNANENKCRHCIYNTLCDKSLC